MKQKEICIFGIIFMIILISMGIYFLIDEPYEIEYLDNPDEVISSYVAFPYWYEECKMKPDVVHRYPLTKGTAGLLEEGQEGYLLYYRHSGRDDKCFEFTAASEEERLITNVKEIKGTLTDEIFAIISFDAGVFEMDEEPKIEMSWEHGIYVEDLFEDMEKDPYEIEIRYFDDISDYPNATEAMVYWNSMYSGPSVFPVEDGYLVKDWDYKNADKKIDVILETSGSILSIQTCASEEEGDGSVLFHLPKFEETFGLRNVYLNGKSFLNYFVDETIQKATIGWTDWSFLLGAPDGILSSEIIKEINFQFQPSPNSLHCIIRSTFSTPEELHFGSFMKYFQLKDKMSDTEKNDLEHSDVWINECGVVFLPYATKPYRAETINNVLEYYLNLTIDDLKEEGKIGYIYFPEYDTYYTQSSDWGPGMFTCSSGEKEGNIVRLYGVSYVDNFTDELGKEITSCIILEEVDGRYLFKSHTEIEETL